VKRLFLSILALSLFAGTSQALFVRLPDGTIRNGYVNTIGRALAKPARRLPSDFSYLTPKAYFRIHYNTSGTAAVPPTDDNASGVPDWVEFVGQSADSIRQVYMDMGYTRTLDDAGGTLNGGGVEYDIYLTELADDGVYGLTWFGPNGYMQLDDDYAESIYVTSGKAALRVTLAHEMFHSIQFTYYDGAEWVWWMEATAVFMEDVLYPDINDYWQYLSPTGFVDTFFENPTQSLYESGLTPNSAHMYGAAVFCHFLDQHDRVKGRSVIRETMERMAELRNGDVPVIAGVIENRLGEPMNDLLARFWVWSYFTGDRTRPGFSFEDAEGYTSPPPNMLPKYQWVVEDLSTKGESVGLHTVSPLGGWITQIDPDGSTGGIRITFSPQNDETENWSWRVAVASGYSVQIIEPDGDHVEIGGWDTYDDIIVVAGNGMTSGYARSFMITATYDQSLTKPTPAEIELELAQNQPNPFNVGTTLPFTLTEDANVTVRVYDVTGRLVRTLVRNAPYVAGYNTVAWDGLMRNGRKTGSGVYLARVVAGKAVRVRAMTLVR
jgi:hypothetical protein